MAEERKMITREEKERLVEEAVNKINDSLPGHHTLKDDLDQIRKEFNKDLEESIGENIRKHTIKYFEKMFWKEERLKYYARDDLTLSNCHFNIENDTIYLFHKDIETYLSIFDKEDLPRVITWLQGLFKLDQLDFDPVAILAIKTQETLNKLTQMMREHLSSEKYEYDVEIEKIFFELQKLGEKKEMIEE